MVNTLASIRDAVIKQIPPHARFTERDAAVILSHKTFLLGLEDDLVRGFYDMLYEHKTTRAVFHNSERRDREMSLREWWRRIVKGPYNQEFWDWMVFVGLIHVKRKVKNPMMLSAWGFIMGAVIERARLELTADEALELSESFNRLGQTFSSFIADGYLVGLMDAVGGNMDLLERLASQEISFSIEDYRRTIGRSPKSK